MLRRCLPLFVFVLAVLSVADAQTPLRLVNVTPCRLVDTRPPSGAGPIQGGTFETFNLRSLAQAGGVGCQPFSLSTAQAYSLNVTLVPVNGGPVAYLTIWPTGEPQPLVSLMNSDGRVKANAAIVPAGTSGEVSVYVTNTTNVLIDIDAYFDAASDDTALAFFPLTPCRIIDTRNGDSGPLQAGVERDYTIPPACEIPSAAAAYSFNVTVIPNHGAVDYLTVWPKGETQPVVSTLNDNTGTIVANAAIVPAGSDNATAFYAHSNSTNLLLDVNGYFAPASSASNPLSLFTLTPCRILDTRNGIGLFNDTISVGIVGSACGVPPASPEAFVLNATVVPDGDLLYLSLWPEGQSQPTVSTLNANDGAVTSNMAIVPAGSGNDSIDAFAPTDTQLILDISSYFGSIAPVTIQTGSLPNGTLNDGYSMQLVASGGVAPYTWQKTAGNLPPTLSLGGGGLIQGTTTQTGMYNFTVKVTDSNSPASTATANLAITVASTGQPVAVTTTSLPAATVNTFYNALLTANGGITPYTWSILSGTLPTGLTLNASTGQITGQPGSAGLWQFTIKVTDSQQNTATAALAIAVNTGNANGTLNGQYTFSFSGYSYDDGQLNNLVVAGSFTFNGNGGITGGELDSNNNNAGIGHQFSQITGGTYSVNSNGLGQISFNESDGGGAQLLVSTGSGEDVRVIAYNTQGSQGYWGAGVMRQQNAADFTESALAGNWAFGLQGVDSSGDPLAADGAFKLSGSTISNGIEDINDFGTHTQATFTGTITSSPAFDANGRATVRSLIDGAPINEAVYVVSASEMVLTDIDSGGYMFVENTQRQSGSFNQGSLNGNAIARGSRKAKANSDSPISEALVGQIETSGNGNISIAEDINGNGTFGQQTVFGTYAVASNSRTVITPSSGGMLACYLITTNQGYCINAVPQSGSNVDGAEVIYFEPQSAGPFSNASYSGEYLGGSLPQYISSTLSQIDSNVSSGAATFSSVYSWSGPNGTQQNQTLNGTYNVDATTGAITFSVEGSPVYAGFLVSPNKVEYVTAASGSNPLVLVEVTSSAPRHP
ncbi:MAG: Ig domain-containing protein [Candidatus Korobacteraceae bacterium]